VIAREGEVESTAAEELGVVLLEETSCGYGYHGAWE